MLVLARGVGQSVEIADGIIEVTVLSVTGSIVRLGFKADRNITILRKEKADEERANGEGDTRARPNG